MADVGKAEWRLDVEALNEFLSWAHLTLGDECTHVIVNMSDGELQEVLDRYYADRAATEDFQYWSRSTEPGNVGRDDA